MLISRAYGLIDAAKQIAGPGWIDGPQFAVDARIPVGTTREQFQKMLQKMLADRFGLVVHRETTILPIYELVVAKNGPKFRVSPDAGDNPGKPPSGQHDPNGFPEFSGPGLILSYGPGGVCHLSAQQQTMAAFAKSLGRDGKYDFKLQYDIERVGVSQPDELSLSVFEALQQQLGLKLVDAKEPVDLIVIDHSEKTPTEN